MEKTIYLMLGALTLSLVTFRGDALSTCNGPCKTLNDCLGQLICISGMCNDDPDVGTHICSASTSPPPPLRSPPPPLRSSPPPPLIRSPPPPVSLFSPPPPSTSCTSTGTLTCGSSTYKTYTCSPPVISSTPAKLTNNNFCPGGDGGGPSECDGLYHCDGLPIVALSTGWYNGGSRCGRMINIRASNGRTVLAKVVDECDSTMGCDTEHAGQPPCQNNIVDGSDAVWNALGLNIDLGIVDVTWSMA